jgi:Cytochrome oxidase c subunit VIb
VVEVTVRLSFSAAEALVRSASRTHETRVDRRFPNTNQANNCWTAFNEYQICVEKRGRDDSVCLQRGRDYAAVCPQKWVEEWKDQLASGKAMFV